MLFGEKSIYSAEVSWETSASKHQEFDVTINNRTVISEAFERRIYVRCTSIKRPILNKLLKVKAMVIIIFKLFIIKTIFISIAHAKKHYLNQTINFIAQMNNISA